MTETKVRDIMFKNVFVTHQNDTLADVMRLLVENRIGGVPIVNDNQELLAFISDGNILRNIKPIKEEAFTSFAIGLIAHTKGEELEAIVQKVKNKSAMDFAKKKRIITVSPDETIDDVIRVFADHRFKNLPVVDSNNKVVGMLNHDTVLRHIQKTILDKVNE